MHDRGFTLIELLLAVSLIGLIAIAAFASLDAVVRSSDEGTAALDRLREQRVLKFELRDYLQQAYAGTAVADDGGPRHVFRGMNGLEARGFSDHLLFSTLARIPGVTELPGAVAYVSIGTEEDEETNETALYVRVVSDLTALENDELEPFAEDDERDVTSTAFSMPVESLELRYYDGEAWIDEWDSEAQGRLPWSVELALRYPDTHANDDADYIVTVLIPAGSGTLEHLDVIQEDPPKIAREDDEDIDDDYDDFEEDDGEIQPEEYDE